MTLMRGSGNTANLADEDPDALGWWVVSGHENTAGDIVFAHGLGGSAWKTRSWDREPAGRWLPWLANQADLSSHRILAFGYNAMFKEAPRRTSRWPALLGISCCRRSIIFVAHSVGDLEVKTAFLLGREDQYYSSLIVNIFSMVFLAIPH